MEFNEIKTEYENCREKERQAIRDHLIDRGFIVSKSSRAGKGVINYTSSGRIKPYDLSNWKYIIAAKDGKKSYFSPCRHLIRTSIAITTMTCVTGLDFMLMRPIVLKMYSTT